jgi:pyruvate carboxylase
MQTAMDAVLSTGRLLEATMCYTGDILDPKRDKYTLQYYVDFAKELEKRGAHHPLRQGYVGLLKPYGAKKLITALKEEIGIPIHLHTHNTTDNQIAAYLLAAGSGRGHRRLRHRPLSSMTSQPSFTTRSLRLSAGRSAIRDSIPWRCKSFRTTGET